VQRVAADGEGFSDAPAPFRARSADPANRRMLIAPTVFSSRTIQPSIDWCSDRKTGLSVYEPHCRAAYATATYMATIDIDKCVRAIGR
jgi:hypothetical protein